jgi:DNA-directed RNA polymerase specialized sigma24 family protein
LTVAATPAADKWSRRSAFAAFYSAHSFAMVRMVSALEGRGEVDEAVQAATAELYAQWDLVEKPAAWVKAVAVNHLRKTPVRNRRLHVLGESLALWSVESAPAADRALLDRQWVAQLLDALPAAQRAVVTGVLEGLSTGEIAEWLGKTPLAVRKYLQLARERLRREIAAQEAE